MGGSQRILDARQMHGVIRRMASEIAERHGGVERLLLVGVRTRGVPLAERLATEIEALAGRRPPLGILDINLYRDDFSTVGSQPVVRETHLPPSLEDWLVVLCDDVLYTGRTVRAALDALVDYGRPRAVELAVLVDRGLRELPIQADIVGERVATAPGELVEVRFAESDGLDEVLLSGREEG
ncbi:MAG: bifunctional pyr operon transcriptional regulator/uracil phosphoribosyltransferase PyrR [Thermoanaerobaculia bacterium]